MCSVSFEQVLAGATLEEDRKRKKRALKEENDRQSILHEIFNNDQLLHQKHHTQIVEKQRTSNLSSGLQDIS